MAIKRFKELTGDDSFAGRIKTYSDTITVSGGDITYYYITNPGSAAGHNTESLRGLYHSFGLAQDEGDWWNTYQVYDHINAGDMIVGVFADAADLGSYVQGNNIEIKVPVNHANSSYSYYSSTWNTSYTDTAGEELASEYHPTHRDHGSAVAFLFADDRWTGDTTDVSADPTSQSWSSSPSGLNHRATLASRTTGIANSGDTVDGIVLLEKGIFCVFDNINRGATQCSANHSDDTIWNGATADFTAINASGTTNSNPANRYGITFTGTSANSSCQVIYNTVTNDHKLVFFCHAKPSEFNSTSNHTYDHQKAFYRPDEADPLYVTEVALYCDADKNKPIAYAKLSEPIEKTKFDTFTLKVEVVV